MKKVLIINGPNLNLLGLREPDIYGSVNMEMVLTDLVKQFPETDIDYKQSQKEHKLIEWMHKYGFFNKKNYGGIILNAAAYSHYSYALADAIAMAKIPVVNVHISDINSREQWRKKDVIAPYCSCSIVGKGIAGYGLALDYINKIT